VVEQLGDLLLIQVVLLRVDGRDLLHLLQEVVDPGGDLVEAEQLPLRVELQHPEQLRVVDPEDFLVAGLERLAHQLREPV
jgi:hypothetical protein